MGVNWNEEATKLGKTFKVETGAKWKELASAISEASLEDDISAQTLSNAINKGNYNVRLLLQMCNAMGYDIVFRKKD